MTATLKERPKSGIPGIVVRPSNGLWEVRKQFMGTSYYLGLHETLDAAKAALAAWEPSDEDKARAAVPRPLRGMKQQPYAPQRLHADGFPTLGRTRMTDEQVEYALSIAHELRGF